MADKNKSPSPKKQGASIALEGKTEEDFKLVKDRIESVTPGIRPKNADVLRYALHLAATQCKTELKAATV